MNRQPERSETNAVRQARLRERWKAQGFRRTTLWLSPEQVDTLESSGGEPWLGTAVKTLRDNAKPATAPDKADSLNTGGMAWEALAR